MGESQSGDGLAGDARRQIERIEQMQHELSAQSGFGKSTRDVVRVITGPSGMLREIQIHPDAMRLSPGDLAAEVKTAVTAAQADYAAKADAIMAPILGASPGKEIAHQYGLD
jgi:DNA-binding protein YbaB